MAGGGEVNNGQPTVAQANPSAVREALFPQTRVVGTAVGLDISHTGEGFAITPVDQAGDATHQLCFLFDRACSIT